MSILEDKSVTQEKKVQDLGRLLEITKAFQVEKDLDALLAIIITETTKILDAERSSLFLVDRAAGQLYIKIGEGLDDPQSQLGGPRGAEPPTSKIRFPIGKGIAGAVARDRLSANIPDAYADERFNSEFDRQTGFRTRSILCSPLLTHEDKVVGVIQVLNKKGGPFQSYDENLLAAISVHAAIAIDNAQLFDHYVEKQRIQAALNIAHRIQRSLLPDQAPRLDGYEIHGFSEACDETGGDYYDFLQLGDGNLGLVVGDVSGHGVGAALLMASARATLRAFLKTAVDLRRVFCDLNAILEQDMEDGRFITLFFGDLELATGRIEYISAGHDQPILMRGSTGRFEFLESTSLPLGMFSPYECQPEFVRMDRGDLLLLCTDGLWEAKNDDLESFGRDAVCKLLAASRHLGPDRIVEALRSGVVAHMGDRPRDDDLTTIVVKRL